MMTFGPRRGIRAALCALSLALAGAASPPSHAAGNIVPFDLVDGHIFVTARVDGSGPLRFVIDTGASDVIAADTAAALGLRTGSSFTLYGTGERAEHAQSAHVDSLDLGGATLTDQRFTVLPLAELRSAEGVDRFDGLIGHELFDRYVVRIDYESRTLTLETVEDAADAAGHAIPLRFYGAMPEVDGSVDGISGRFTVDTGDRGSLSLLVPFVAQHDLIARYHTTSVGIAGWGIGGPVRARLTRVHVLSLAGIDVREPVTRLPDAQHGFFTSRAVAGNIGYGVLRRFTATFDYARRRLVLLANADIDAPDLYDRSGMWLVQNPGGFAVADVREDGAAAAAGIRDGDLIQAIDGRSTADIGLAPERSALRTSPPGTAVKLRVLRGDRTLQLTLRLADVI